MRNMKRVLSLVLAMVMMLGMLTIPTGAANNFTDADQIVNKDAVNIISGLKIMEGVGDNTFNPQGTVTRAQMATIIVKMMYGSDFNADSFKGTGNPFPDTAGFEGGWAEGYINACFQMGVVKGYGDGTFKPGNQVTTAEAVTMIINALKIDAGEGEWPNTVMAKATELKLFGDLKPAPATNDVLVRDQLAVITLEGLQCSPSGSNTYSYTTPGGKTFEFTSLEDAMATIGVENADSITVNPADDTLAKKVYNLKIETGFVTDNQATGADCTVVGEMDFDVETGLDMIGHYVSVYYQVPKSGQSVDAYKVYSVIDESVVVTVSKDISNTKDYKAAFTRNYEPADSVLVFESDYSLSEDTTITGSYNPGSIADAGTYIINENKVVAYLKPAAQYASYIASITEFNGEKRYMLGGGKTAISEDEITLYMGAAKGDVVTYVKAKDQYVLSPVDPIKGTVTKVSGNITDGYVLTLNGREYKMFDGVENNADGAELTTIMNVDNFAYGEQLTVYLTQDDKVVGWKQTSGGAGDVDVSKIVYAKGAYKTTEKDTYGVKTDKYFLHAVDFEGNEVQLLLAQSDLTGDYATVNTAAYVEGFYVVEDYDGNDKDVKKADIKTVSRVGLLDEIRESETDENGLTYAENLFYGSNRWASGLKIPAGQSNNHICSAKCEELSQGPAMGGGVDKHNYIKDDSKDAYLKRTFFNDATKFLMVEGDLGEPLKCGAGGEDFSYTMNTTYYLSMLYTEDDSGLVDVVMVVIPRAPADVTTVYPTLYVTGESAGSSAQGDVYHAYVANSGEPQEIVVRPGTDVTKGFMEYTINEDGWYELTPTTVGSAYEDMVIWAITSSGLVNILDPNHTGTDKPDTPSGANASNAKIIDLRDDDNVRDSGVGELTDLEQLRTLREEDYVINADIYSSDTSVKVIYVTSTYKTDKSMVYYVTATGKAGDRIPAYNTKTGALENIAVTEKTDVLGFATIVDETSYSTTLAPVVDDNYYDKDVIESLSVDGNNVIVTERDEGRTVTVTPNTVFGQSSFGVTSIAALKAKYAALEGSESYTYSYIANEAGEATFFVVVDKGDPDVSDGDLIKTITALPATAEGGQVEDAWKETGNLAGDKHPISYVSVSYPEGVGADTLTDTKEFYYTASKDEQGGISLTFAYNLKPREGDVIFVPGTVLAGDVVEGHVLSRTDVDPEEVVFVGTSSDSTFQVEGTTAAGGPARTRGRFWTVNSSNEMVAVQGTSSAYMNGYAHKVTYHDAIRSWDPDGRVLVTKAGAGHTGSGTNCGYNSSYSCDDGGAEANRTQNVPANVPIINLTDYTINDVDDIEFWGEGVIVNLYVPEGAKNTVGTVGAIVVLYPTPDTQPGSQVIVDTDIEGGSISVDPKFGAIGDTITVTADPKLHWTLGTILVDGEPIEGNTFTITEDEHTVSAIFVEDHKALVSVGDVENGEVKLFVGDEEHDPADPLYVGEEVKIECAPNRKFELEDILVNGDSMGEDYDKLVIEDGVDSYVVTATFKESTAVYTATVAQLSNGTVTISAPEAGSANDQLSDLVSGDVVTITATPDDTTAFAVGEVTVKTGDEEPVVIPPVEGVYTFTVTGNATVNVTFVPVYTITATGATVSVDKAKAGDVVTITPTLENGYVVNEVTVKTGDADPVVITPVEGVYTFTVSGDAIVTATSVYAPQNGDVFYIQELVTASSVVNALVIDTNNSDLSVGDFLEIKAPATLNPNIEDDEEKKEDIEQYNTNSFWTTKDGKFYRFIGIYNNEYHGVGSYQFSYHDRIQTYNAEENTIERRNMHNNSSTCAASAWNKKDNCGDTAIKQNDEVTRFLSYADDVPIINLTGETLTGTADEQVATLMDLTFNSDKTKRVAYVNFYAANGTKESTTVEVDVILVVPIDPANMVWGD